MHKNQKNIIAITSWLLAIICSLLMLKATSDEELKVFEGTWIAAALTQFPNGNQIIFDLVVGVLVSQFMYVLVVWLPDYNKRHRVRANLERQYDLLKEECIKYFLFACNEPAGYDLIRDLKDRQKFKEFFKTSIGDHQNKWHGVLNGLTSDHIEDILIELEIFKGELEYALNVIDISDEAAFRFLRNLTGVLHRSKKWSEEYDQLKPLSQFMWSVFTGWDWAEGYTNRDRVAEMIKKI